METLVVGHLEGQIMHQKRFLIRLEFSQLVFDAVGQIRDLAHGNAARHQPFFNSVKHGKDDIGFMILMLQKKRIRKLMEIFEQ